MLTFSIKIMWKMFRCGQIILMLLLWSCATLVYAKEVKLSAADEDFIALREASRDNRTALVDRFSNRLTQAQYDVPSYVAYYYLKAHLESTPHSEIRHFLTQYEGSAIADRLRNDWLLLLGQARNWKVFDEQYPLFVLDDDVQLKCYALQSRLGKGKKVAQEAKELIVSGKDFGPGCFSLIAGLLKARQFDESDVWEYIRLAAETNNPGFAKQLANVLGSGLEKKVALAFNQVSLTVARGAGSTEASRQIYMAALGRMAVLSEEKAAHSLLANAKNLSPEDQAQAWVMIALRASLNLSPKAIEYWSYTEGARLSYEAQQWRVRMNLRSEKWDRVQENIEAMPHKLKNRPTWVYWLGRAYKAKGNTEQAEALFSSIADQFHFYGQLALEEKGKKIVVVSNALTVTQEEILAIAENPGLKRALKFLDMNLRFEGTREWNWELRKMNDRQYLAAAEWARQNQVLDRMLVTSERTKKEFNFEQRFPSPYRDVMYVHAKNTGVDVAWAYGLIRQESRFVMNARSHVGASGLMQLMPQTAKWVAKKIGLDGFSLSRVNEIDTNILLGTHYLRMISADFNGSQTLATAAYNAGPGRPRAWKATLAHSVEGAIFAETIPFEETRGYVKNVLSNATYYAALFDGQPQSLRARLGRVGVN